MAIVYDENGFPVLDHDYDYEAHATGEHEAPEQPGYRGDHDLYLSQLHPDKAAEGLARLRPTVEKPPQRSVRWPTRPPVAAPPAPLPTAAPLPPLRPRTDEEERLFQERVQRALKELRKPDAAPYVWRALARQRGRYR